MKTNINNQNFMAVAGDLRLWAAVFSSVISNLNKV